MPSQDPGKAVVEDLESDSESAHGSRTFYMFKQISNYCSSYDVATDATSAPSETALAAASDTIPTIILDLESDEEEEEEELTPLCRNPARRSRTTTKRKLITSDGEEEEERSSRFHQF